MELKCMDKISVLDESELFFRILKENTRNSVVLNGICLFELNKSYPLEYTKFAAVVAMVTIQSYEIFDEKDTKTRIFFSIDKVIEHDSDKILQSVIDKNPKEFYKKHIVITEYN